MADSGGGNASRPPAIDQNRWWIAHVASCSVRRVMPAFWSVSDLIVVLRAPIAERLMYRVALGS